MTERTRFIEHNGRQILQLDFSGLEAAEVVDAIGEAEAFVAKQEKGSLLTLTNVRGAKFDGKVAKALWQLARHNKPYVKAGAVVGIEGLQKDLYHLVTHQSRRKLPPFDDIEAAKDWLVEQASGEDGVGSG